MIHRAIFKEVQDILGSWDIEPLPPGNRGQVVGLAHASLDPCVSACGPK